MAVDTSKIDAIIFDLGGVIINLDTEATFRAFTELSGKTLEAVREMHNQVDFFHKYEAGVITDSQFRDAIRDALEIEETDDVIDQAWNSMLLDIPKYRMEMLETLSADFQLFVLSNTNYIHIRKFLKTIEILKTGRSFHAYFNKVYFSPEIGAMKPNKEAWFRVIQESNLDPSKTLFIDDRKDNIDTAMALGLQTFHNVNPDDWISLF